MPSERSEEFSDLLRRAIQGDPDAVAEIYGRYEARVRARVRQRLTPALRRQFDTIDIGQSVFADVLEDLPEFEDRGERAFLHWLYVRAERKVIAKQRRAPLGLQGGMETRDGGVHPLDAPSPEPDPSERVNAADETRKLNQLMSGLTENERRAVEMRTQDRATFRQIADALGLGSEDAARKRYARALRKLEGRWSKK